MTGTSGDSRGGVMSRAARLWTGFWFGPESALNLALARILVATHALWLLASRDYAAMSDVPAVFWRPEDAGIRWRFLIVPGHGDLERILQIAAGVALAGVILGVAPRMLALVAALLLYHLGPLEAALWTASPIGRGMTIAPAALLVLAAAPCGDALALGRRQEASRAEASEDYGWGLRLIQLLVVEIYLFSAIGKLERTGLDWGSAEHMRLWLLWFNQDDQARVVGALGPWLAQSLWVTGAIGAGTLLLEWTMPLALVSRRARLILVPAALLFHVGVLLAMNIHVPEAWLVLVLVDWGAVSRRLRRRSGPTVPA